MLPNLPSHKYGEIVQTFPHIFWHSPNGVAPPGRETRGLSRGQVDDQFFFSRTCQGMYFIKQKENPHTPQ